MRASCSRAPAGPSLAAVVPMALDVPALQLRELSRTWRVTTSPRGRPIATAQSACPEPRRSMVPVGSRCCRPQAPGQGAGAQVSRASGWSTPSRTRLGVSTLGEEAEGSGERSLLRSGEGTARSGHHYPGHRAISGCSGKREAVCTVVPGFGSQAWV